MQHTTRGIPALPGGGSSYRRNAPMENSSVFFKSVIDVRLKQCESLSAHTSWWHCWGTAVLMTDPTIVQGANLYPGINTLTSLHCLQIPRPQTRPESCYLRARLILMIAKKRLMDSFANTRCEWRAEWTERARLMPVPFEVQSDANNSRAPFFPPFLMLTL